MLLTDFGKLFEQIFGKKTRIMATTHSDPNITPTICLRKAIVWYVVVCVDRRTAITNPRNDTHKAAMSVRGGLKSLVI